jgi:hypothetical protein
VHIVFASVDNLCLQLHVTSVAIYDLGVGDAFFLLVCIGVAFEECIVYNLLVFDFQKV